MDDFFDEHDDYDDGDFMDEDPFDDEMDDDDSLEQEDLADDAESPDGFGLDWQDWMIIGPLSEEIARERLERDRIKGKNDTSDDDYWDIIQRPW